MNRLNEDFTATVVDVSNIKSNRATEQRIMKSTSCGT